MNPKSSYPHNNDCNKILPLPLYRKNIENGSKAQKESLIRGNKYFSKVSAVGETTKATLQALYRSYNSKRIYKLQFDAYLCEKSCLTDLCKAFRKIQRLQDLNLVLRRLDIMNESKIVTPFVKKQIGLRRLRLELPRTKNINDEGVVNLAKMLGKCATLQSYEEAIVCLENVSGNTYESLSRYGQKNIYIKEFKITSIKIGNLDNAQACGMDPENVNPRPNNRLKKITIHSGVKTGWFSVSPDCENETVKTLKNVNVPENLESFSGKFSGVPSIDQVIALFNELPRFKSLNFWGVEFSNCRMTDLEVITICQILNKSRQVKEVSLKVIQYPNISKDCIFYLLRTLAQLENLTKFNVYIRRLSLDDMEINDLLESISYLPELECICFQKQSLHVFRKAKDGMQEKIQSIE